MLINLRKFVSQVNITDMLKDITFKKENDIFYIEGQREGHKSGQHEGDTNARSEVVENLLHAGKFTVSEIANFASVDEAFVKKVRAKLSQKN
ncbi:MAG: hypothetical protein LBE82_03270 [Chitinophagaceae bacterium]|nr:hypothetical protein [Chitinophagaceae bacterium]